MVFPGERCAERTCDWWRGRRPLVKRNGHACNLLNSCASRRVYQKARRGNYPRACERIFEERRREREGPGSSRFVVHGDDRELRRRQQIPGTESPVVFSRDALLQKTQTLSQSRVIFPRRAQPHALSSQFTGDECTHKRISPEHLSVVYSAVGIKSGGRRHTHELVDHP